MPKAKTHVTPKTGTIFEKKFLGRNYKMTVVKSDGVVAYSVAGQQFKSPSAAAKSITKHDENGWKFWGIDSPNS